MPLKDYIKAFFWAMLLGASIAMVAAIIHAPGVNGAMIEEPKYTVPVCDLPFKVDTSHYVGHKEMENGLTLVIYETGPNEVFAVALVTEDRNNPYPLFYAIGDKKDPHKTWVDQHRDGSCDGITQYWTDPKKEV